MARGAWGNTASQIYPATSPSQLRGRERDRGREAAISKLPFLPIHYLRDEERQLSYSHLSHSPANQLRDEEKGDHLATAFPNLPVSWQEGGGEGFSASPVFTTACSDLPGPSPPLSAGMRKEPWQAVASSMEGASWMVCFPSMALCTAGEAGAANEVSWSYSSGLI